MTTDIALVKNIVLDVLEIAQKAGASRITEVQLTLSSAYLLTEPKLEEYFAIMTYGTLAENASLTIQLEQTTFICCKCSHKFKSVLSQTDLSCWECGSRVVELDLGRKFHLESVGMVRGQNQSQKSWLVAA